MSTSVSPARDRRKLVGRLGEEIAACHLGGLGYRIVERNYRTRRGEIDIIALDGTTLAFVEVKAHRIRAPRGRTAPSGARLPGSLEPSLGWPSMRQRLRLRRLAAAWIANRARGGGRVQEVRFDAIKVNLQADGSLISIEHVKSAF